MEGCKRLVGANPGQTLLLLAFNWFCGMKYHKSLWRLLQEVERGSLGAAKQISAVWELFHRWRFGLLRLKDVRFKTGADHYTLMLGGLDAGFADLSERQLADWYDENCSCRKEHTQGALGQLRTRTLRELEEGYLVGPPLQAHAATSARTKKAN